LAAASFWRALMSKKLAIVCVVVGYVCLISGQSMHAGNFRRVSARVDKVLPLSVEQAGSASPRPSSPSRVLSPVHAHEHLCLYSRDQAYSCSWSITAISMRIAHPI
jgi:hypothetical protein